MTWHGDKERYPDGWRKTVIVLLHIGKENQDECNTNRGISILSVSDKIYGSILNIED